ncbi:hypothetical protein JCM19037_1600 [Geomicrobium sp. JCM 19037]|uniref:hypothetical protein n=1 Tax=Geomicrobium sp. JCM 19037 TaxID=1460634 RepID=UPI00045F4355|nr:hypothetical protein [Geomicrobium sp. JCM 19037]GAK03287.1 hypothetical protein JCM19037_1600 [Geomicrobium sp. JCM 19037]
MADEWSSDLEAELGEYANDWSIVLESMIDDLIESSNGFDDMSATTDKAFHLRYLLDRMIPKIKEHEGEGDDIARAVRYAHNLIVKNGEPLAFNMSMFAGGFCATIENIETAEERPVRKGDDVLYADWAPPKTEKERKLESLRAMVAQLEYELEAGDDDEEVPEETGRD